MKRIMIKLTSKWIDYLKQLPETGMDYQVVSISLKDGRKINQAVITGGYISKVRNMDILDFKEEDIASLVVTHEKWNWNTD